jgi:bacterioferritin
MGFPQRTKEERTMASKKPSAELLDLLNQAIAREIQVSVQYMWQHVLWKGVQGYAVKDAFKMTAISEMKHAESIAERLNYLGGIPTTKPTPIFIGTTLKQMIEADKKAEEEAITMYKKIIQLARKEGDETTEFLFTKILSDEEDHHDLFTSLLEKD